jgi:hypothetical protein
MRDTEPAADGVKGADAPRPTDEATPGVELPPELEFEPVPRKVRRPDGWTPELQRQFIKLLAESGSPARAAEALGKRVGGIEAIYRQADAESFRAAWDKAVAIAQRRERSGGGAAGREPPHRRDPWDQGADEQNEDDEQEKLDLIANIGVKFLRKTQQERECRLAGELVAADYYLRQMTVLEVMLDLMASGWTFERTWPRLMSLRGKHSSLFMIADTPFVRLLDARRREMWAADGEPPRPPETFREEFLRDFGDHRACIDSHSFGATSEPARGYCKEEWATMNMEEQKAAREQQYADDAAEQIEWERHSRAAWEEWRATAERNERSRSDK